MQRAALYARVSTDAQKQEGTIESQIAELRRQIAAAGHVLVKEYIDDGYTGSRMDRPALQELRRDLRADVFDVIYFLAADRIARAVIYQTIIIGEMLLHKKDIVINGQQYIDKSENKFTMTVLGAVAELERAKITERMTRGKLHRLRQGVMASGGVAPFGYRYTQPSPNAPRALAPQEPEAEVVRWMFETYAAGATLRSLAKSLEQRGVRTRFGKELWAYAQIRDMMNNPTYAGMRYFNRRTEVKDDPQRKRGRTILRDRSEWIGIAVPPLVSTELFDRVQERLAENLQRYLQPAAHYALSGLVECGECGSAFCSYRRYVTKELVTGVKRVSHKAAYKCNWRVRQLEHDAKLVERCRNPEVATHLLEGKVFEMIRETMFDPSKLRACVQAPVKRDGERGIARRLGSHCAPHRCNRGGSKAPHRVVCLRAAGEPRVYRGEPRARCEAREAQTREEGNRRGRAAARCGDGAGYQHSHVLRGRQSEIQRVGRSRCPPRVPRRAHRAHHLSQAPGDHRRRSAAAID